MTFIVESGSGTPGANAYATVSFVDGYLADRARESENEWSSQTTARKQAAIVAATSYIDRRWGGRARGLRLRSEVEGRAASGSFTFGSLPLVGEVVTVGQITYRFVDALAAENDVLRGGTATAAAENLAAAINVGGLVAVAHQDTRVNSEVEASSASGVLLVEAAAEGVAGDSIPFATDVTGATITGTGTLAGGIDRGPQPLVWPRRAAYSDDGRRIVGVPLPLRQAAAEYAVRSLAAPLDPDPLADDRGALVQRKAERVGPISEETTYAAGAMVERWRSYSAADGLMRELVAGSGGVYR